MAMNNFHTRIWISRLQNGGQFPRSHCVSVSVCYTVGRNSHLLRRNHRTNTHCGRCQAGAQGEWSSHKSSHNPQHAGNPTCGAQHALYTDKVDTAHCHSHHPLTPPATTTTLQSIHHGPLTRYVKIRFAHAPGMPGMVSPSPTSKETAS